MDELKRRQLPLESAMLEKVSASIHKMRGICATGDLRARFDRLPMGVFHPSFISICVEFHQNLPGGGQDPTPATDAVAVHVGVGGCAV